MLFHVYTIYINILVIWSNYSDLTCAKNTKWWFSKGKSPYFTEIWVCEIWFHLASLVQPRLLSHIETGYTLLRLYIYILLINQHPSEKKNTKHKDPQKDMISEVFFHPRFPVIPPEVWCFRKPFGDLHGFTYSSVPKSVRSEKWWISGVFTQGTGFKLRYETDKYGSSYNMLEDGFAGKNLGHEMGLKKDTVVIKNGVKYTHLLHVWNIYLHLSWI